MQHFRMRTVPNITMLSFAAVSLAAAAPDIRSVEADLVVPKLAVGKPAPGRRVAVNDANSGVPVVLYLPTDWEEGKRYPVILELPGNGGFRSSFGDECSGRPEGCKLGYGITAGRGAIWVSVPFVNGKGDGIAITWWGDKPGFKPEPTVALIKRVVERVCHKTFGGDSEHIFLAGFSRGAIACNAIGLHDEEIAKLWRGMIPYSHYDGVRAGWPFAGSDRKSALKRLKRLGTTPQFVCHETGPKVRTALWATRDYLKATEVEGNFTLAETGFRNHNDAWTLRPSKARDELRAWFWRLAKR